MLTLRFLHKPYYSHLRVPQQRHLPNSRHRLGKKVTHRRSATMKGMESGSVTLLTTLHAILDPRKRETV